jgi:hypothetical protein
MSKCQLQTLLKGLLISMLLWSVTAEAAIKFNLKNLAEPKISIRVGKKGEGSINVVRFSIDASQLGSGNAIVSSKTIRIELVIQATGANPLTGFLTVDSFSDPLTNTASTSTIPFTEISWTAQDGDIPSGTFMGTTDQPIVSFQSSTRYRDFHRFSYANTLAIESGIYRGGVTYTWAVP